MDTDSEPRQQSAQPQAQDQPQQPHHSVLQSQAQPTPVTLQPQHQPHDSGVTSKADSASRSNNYFAPLLSLDETGGGDGVAAADNAAGTQQQIHQHRAAPHRPHQQHDQPIAQQQRPQTQQPQEMPHLQKMQPQATEQHRPQQLPAQQQKTGELADTDSEIHQQITQLRAPIQHQRHHPQPTLQQQEGELKDTTASNTEQSPSPLQHGTAPQQQLQQQQPMSGHPQQNPELQPIAPDLPGLSPIADQDEYDRFTRCAEFKPQNTADS